VFCTLHNRIRSIVWLLRFSGSNAQAEQSSNIRGGWQVFTTDETRFALNRKRQQPSSSLWVPRMAGGARDDNEEQAYATGTVHSTVQQYYTVL
jgi:hypothetical protein